MTIDEAIEWLQDELPSVEKMGRTSLYAAMKLAIEALKYIQRARQHDLYVKPGRLPGESKA
jgi:hypothetical protein